MSQMYRSWLSRWSSAQASCTHFVHSMHIIQGSRGGSSYSSAHTLCNAKFYREFESVNGFLAIFFELLLTDCWFRLSSLIFTGVEVRISDLCVALLFPLLPSTLGCGVGSGDMSCNVVWLSRIKRTGRSFVALVCNTKCLSQRRNWSEFIHPISVADPTDCGGEPVRRRGLNFF